MSSPICKSPADLFHFTTSQEQTFRSFLVYLKNTPVGDWPEKDKWPMFKGLPDYTCFMVRESEEVMFLVVRFEERVFLPDGNTGRNFHVGKKDPLTKPMCMRF